MLIRLLFFEKLHKSRMRTSSEVQTQTNCYIVHRAVIGGFRSPAFVSLFAFAVCLFKLLF